MTREEMMERIERGEDPRQVSIMKWQDIKAGQGERYGSDNCGLCAQYEANDCKGCPISTNPGHG